MRYRPNHAKGVLPLAAFGRRAAVGRPDRTKPLSLAALLYTLIPANNRDSPAGRRVRWATRRKRAGRSMTAAALDRDAGRCGPYEPEADLG
jgi:hypothetical protein